jgi:hypothetical protein
VPAPQVRAHHPPAAPQIDAPAPNQQAGIPVHAQHPLPQPLGKQKRTAQHQRIQQQASPANFKQLRQGDAEAVHDDSQTQQTGTGKIDPRRHMP